MDVRKVTNENIICLITFCLDFSTLSTSKYVTYLNSKYGPITTIILLYEQLRYFDINVKRASFEPPNRNSIGLRIFRVFWCMKIEDILKDHNAFFFRFINEAAVASCKRKNHGGTFTGIILLYNRPLFKVKISVIILVFNDH